MGFGSSEKHITLARRLPKNGTDGRSFKKVRSAALRGSWGFKAACWGLIELNPSVP
jgi:hypothetical protein